MKKLIILSSCIFTILTIFFSFYYMSKKQLFSPLDTNAQFHLSITDHQQSKEEIIADLNRIARQEGSYFVLTATSAGDSRQRNLYSFGTTPVQYHLTAMRNQQILWLDQSLSGQLLPSEEIADTPLSGMYYCRDQSTLATALRQWADDHSYHLSYYPSTALPLFLFGLLMGDGATLALFLSTLLLITLSICWIQKQNYTKSILLLNGYSRARIQLYYLKKLSICLFPPMLICLIAGNIFVILLLPIEYLSLFLRLEAIELSLLLPGIFLAVSLLSLVSLPDLRWIRQRRFVDNKAHYFHAFASYIALFATLIALIPSFYFLGLNFENQNRHKQISYLGNAVTLSFGLDETIYSKEGSSNFLAFLDQLDPKSIYMNLDFRSQIDLSEISIDPYESITLVNDNYFDQMISRDYTCMPLQLNQLSPTTAHWLSKNLSFWTGQEDFSKHIALYEIRDQELMALGQNSFLGGRIYYPQNTLLLVLSDAQHHLRMSSIFLPLVSNGNVFFQKPEQLRTILMQSTIYPLIASIDSIGHANALQGQDMFYRSILYLFADLLILSILLFCLQEKIQVWTKLRRKENFLRILYGDSLFSIYRMRLMHNFFFALVICILATFLSLKVSFYQGTLSIIFALLLSLTLFLLANMIFYHYFIRREFIQLSHRKELS